MSIQIQNDSPKIQYCWRDHKQVCCIKFYDMPVVLNFGLFFMIRLDMQATQLLIKTDKSEKTRSE